MSGDALVYSLLSFKTEFMFECIRFHVPRYNNMLSKKFFCKVRLLGISGNSLLWKAFVS